ncbi:hypothetical protein [Micromonospora zhanjiangensis]|uniref:Uncharacterized protein n=1 Tax=Micromonospora zhanjiangensis TaxID=1522057 RepID=A0ABV8KI54_9ACTN
MRIRPVTTFWTRWQRERRDRAVDAAWRAGVEAYRASVARRRDDGDQAVTTEAHDGPPASREREQEGGR